MKVILKDQECVGDYQFNSQIYMTRGFQSQFGELAMVVVLETMSLIKERASTVGADYLQVAFCNDTKFWIIDDVDHITFLLPSEY
jgi:hypothetical protein